MTIAIGSVTAADAWSAARDKVRKDLWRPSAGGIPDDQCDRALHSSILELEAEARWLWLENIDGSFTVNPAADNAVLGASVKNISSIAFLSGTTGYDILDMEPLAKVRLLARGASQGFPDCYAYSNGNIYFDTMIAAGSEFELVFTSACPRVLEDAIASPPASLTLQMPAIVANAAHLLSLTYLKNEQEAARQRRAYEVILERLMDEENHARSDAQGGGTIQPDSYYHDMAHGGTHG